MSKKNNLLVAASGTGGHIFPALAVSKNIENVCNIYWLGVQQRLDSNFVPSKYNLLTLDLKTPKKNIFISFQYLRIIFSFFRIVKILKDKQINLVFTTGGYISAPTIIAAKLLNIPVIIHESNLIPGLVTKHFGFLCNYVFTGFKETNSYLKNCRTIFTGTPLREQFYQHNILPKWVPKGEGPLLLIMGGSQGAKALNKFVFESLDFLLKKNFRIVHIIGEQNQEGINNKILKNYVQKKFTHEMAALMQNCDLVIARSGSGTINELIKTKKPSILIPYPYSKNNHQEENAMLLCKVGGSLLINQEKISKDIFEDTLMRIFKLNLKKGKLRYELLDLMKKNMKNIDEIKSIYEIKKILNYFLKEL